MIQIDLLDICSKNFYSWLLHYSKKTEPDEVSMADENVPHIHN